MLGLHLHQVLPLCVLVQAVALCRLLLCVRWLRLQVLLLCVLGLHLHQVFPL